MRLFHYPIKGLQIVHGNVLFRREEGHLLYHKFTFGKHGKIYFSPLTTLFIAHAGKCIYFMFEYKSFT